jgi:hypothetical protein
MSSLGLLQNAVATKMKANRMTFPGTSRLTKINEWPEKQAVPNVRIIPGLCVNDPQAEFKKQHKGKTLYFPKIS